MIETKMKMKTHLPSEDAMLGFGAALAKVCSRCAIIFLHGNLGAGKTTLVRGFLRDLGFEGRVKSPTYTLVESYELEAQQLFHFDLYRLEDPQELEYIGIADYFSQDAICLIEWPELGGSYLPRADLILYITSPESGRDIEIQSETTTGDAILKRLEL